ncbi:MAG: hypothetical protein ABJF88_15125 [Rhodothermales bacterium]
MLRALALLAVLALPTVATAQFSATARLDPIRPDRTPLAAAAEVPDVFLLGLDGTTPLFVNPARAARADDRFVYGTVGDIESQFGSGVPISFDALFGTRDRRWLVSIDNAIASTSSTNEAAFTRITEPDGGTTVTNDQDRLQQLDADRVATRARVVLVGRTDFGGYAVGLFGGYRTNRTERLTDDTRRNVTDQTFGPTRRVQSSRQLFESLLDEGTDEYGIGIEAAFAGKRWDLAASLSYQGRTTSITLVNSNRSEQEFVEMSGGEIVSSNLSRIEQDNEREADASPSGVDFEILGTIRSGLSRGDYLFGLVTGTFASGSADLRTEDFSEQTIQTQSGGETSVDVITFEDDAAFDRDLGTWAGRLSLGYVYAHKRRGLTVLAGVNPHVTFLSADFLDASLFTPFVGTFTEVDDRTISLDLPLHVEAPVSRRLALFGGGLYRYTFASFDVAQRPIRGEDEPPIPFPVVIEESQRRETDTVFTNARLYAGALLTLRSGLTAQAAFRGDLAAYSGWTVSIGYRF